MISQKFTTQYGRTLYNIRKRTFFKKIFGGFFSKDDCDCPSLEQETTVDSGDMCMPVVGLGTWQTPHCNVRDAVCQAIECGYRHIDTALLYGNEEEVGKVLNEMCRSGAVKREELFLSSKLPYCAMCPGLVERSCFKSMENLKTCYLDLYMIHFPVGVKRTDGDICCNKDTSIVDIWREMENLVRDGHVRNIGVSNFNVCQISKILDCAEIPPTNVQIELHLYCQQHTIRNLCREKEIGVTAYAPLGSPGLKEYLKRMHLCSNDIPQPLRNWTIRKIAKHYRKTPAQVLLRYLLQLGNVAVIPKSSCPERVVENIDIFDFCLTRCEMEEMKRMDMKEDGRMFGKNVWFGTDSHPEYPFKIY